jgi:hypothetical protein
MWSNHVRASGDPIKPEVVAQPEAVNLLLSPFVQKEVASK